MRPATSLRTQHISSRYAIAHRHGNNRSDTFENLLVHPEICLFFLIPQNGDSIRISGKGCIARDKALEMRLSVNGKPPSAVLIVTVEEAFLHCAKAVTRSKMWQSEFWPDRLSVPTPAEAMVEHGKLRDTVPEMQAIIDKDAAERLY